MGKDKQKHGLRLKWLVYAALPLILLCVFAIYHDAAYMVFRNLTVQTYRLDETQVWDGGTAYRNIQYADISPSDYLNLYVPDTERPAPLFVLIHGGGFISGDAESRQARLMYRYFRDHGFACATVNYRLAQEAPFPGAVEDCKAAIRYLRAHASKYGYNADHIAVFGESAGGYLAVMCAVTNDTEFNDLPFMGQDKTGDVSAKVDVLVDYYGAVEDGVDADLQTLKIPKVVYQIANNWLSKDTIDGYESIHSFWLRKNISEMTRTEAAVFAPYTYVEENISTGCDLSVWIIHGDCDLTVPYLQSERFSDRLTEILGEDRVSFRLVPGMGHASDPLYSDEELGQLEKFLKDKLTDQ